MGVWGVGIFDDDEAADVRDNYIRCRQDGAAPIEVVRNMTGDWEDDIEDGRLWLALALTQWEYGELEDVVRKQAVTAIAGGMDMGGWLEVKDWLQRRMVLDEVLHKLATTNSRPKKLLARFRDRLEMRVGDIFSYRVSASTNAVLRVVGVQVEDDNEWPIVEVLNWYRSCSPSATQVLSLRAKRSPEEGLPTVIALWRERAGEYPAKKISVLANRPPRSPLKECDDPLPWKMLGKYLADLFAAPVED